MIVCELFGILLHKNEMILPIVVSKYRKYAFKFQYCHFQPIASRHNSRGNNCCDMFHFHKPQIVTQNESMTDVLGLQYALDTSYINYTINLKINLCYL
jgi:hypothetical protein